jgi:hypothetical protein
MLAAGGAVADDVARDDVLRGVEGGLARRAHDDARRRQALADVVVGVAFEPQRDAAGQEGAEGLARGAGERDVDGVVGEALAVVLLGHLVAEHGADTLGDVAHRQVDADRGAVLERVAGASISSLSKCLSSSWSWTAVRRRGGVLGQLGQVEDRAQVEARGLPVVDGRSTSRCS